MFYKTLLSGTRWIKMTWYWVLKGLTLKDQKCVININYILLAIIKIHLLRPLEKLLLYRSSHDSVTGYQLNASPISHCQYIIIILILKQDFISLLSLENTSVLLLTWPDLIYMLHSQLISDTLPGSVNSAMQKGLNYVNKPSWVKPCDIPCVVLQSNPPTKSFLKGDVTIKRALIITLSQTKW